MNDEQYVKAFIGQSAFLTLNRALIKELGLYETAVLSLLIDRYNTISNKEEDWFYTVKEYMQAELNLGRKPIDACLATLSDRGLIEDKRSGVPAKKYYRIDWSNIRNLMDCIAKFSMSKTDNQECPKGTDKIAQNGLVNNKEENKEYNNPLTPYGDLSFVLPEFLPAVTQWLEYKKQRRQKYATPMSLRQMYNNLYQMSGGNPETAARIVAQSIGNNYQGLFPLKNNGTGGNDNGSILDTIAGAERLYRKGFV